MGRHQYSEKSSHKRNYTLNGRAATVSTIACQHAALWSSLYIIGSEIYLFVIQATKIELLPTSALLLSSATMTVLYILLSNIAAYLSIQTQTEKVQARKASLGWFATMLIRLTVPAWIVACAFNIIFTLARHMTCNERISSIISINRGTTCIIQRTGIGAGLLALFVSLALLFVAIKSSNPFRCHLFGAIQDQRLKTLLLPYHETTKQSASSEMSFKCLSTVSLGSFKTLVPSRASSIEHLLPKKPELIAGLGIFTPSRSTLSFLSPRPSLSSIRSHATSILPPPATLLPIPAYFPPHSRGLSGTTTNSLNELARASSDRTVRLVPASPAISRRNFSSQNKSAESLSSIYSRSTSGEKPQRPLLHERTFSANSQSTTSSATWSYSDRSWSSASSTATIVHSPLRMMRRADSPAFEEEVRSRCSSTGSSSDIDDVATLQARLSSMKGPNEFGEVDTWSSTREGHVSYHSRPWECTEDGKKKRLEFTPLMVKKTRYLSKASLF